MGGIKYHEPLVHDILYYGNLFDKIWGDTHENDQ